MASFIQNRLSSARNGVVAAACLLAFGGTAQADVVAWNWVAGPGVLTSSQSGNVTSLTEVNPTSPFGTSTWIAQATVADAGDYSFDFRLQGFFAYYQVMLTLSAVDASGTQTILSAGPASCCDAPSSGFDYVGTYTFTGLSAGENIQFIWTGVNNDSNRNMNSTLTLTQHVPEPASLALVSLALLGAGLTGRRKS